MEGDGERGPKKVKEEKKAKKNIAFLFLSYLAWDEPFDVVYRVDQREEINTNISAA